MPDMSSHEHEPGRPEAGKADYEHSDINISAVIKFGVGLVVFVLLVHLIVFGVNFLLVGYVQERQPVLSSLVRKELMKLPQDIPFIPEPRLQVDEVIDLEKLRKRQENKLNSYGWVDEKKEIVHIPIEKAIQILSDPRKQAEHGIKVEKKK